MKKTGDHHARVPLSVLLPGAHAVVEGIDSGIDPVQQEQLLAYGIAPARAVRVLQQRPLTIVMIDEVELALETSVARRIWVRRE